MQIIEADRAGFVFPTCYPMTYRGFTGLNADGWLFLEIPEDFTIGMVLE